MSRPIQIGDLVRVTSDDTTTLYRVYTIGENEIGIYDIANPSDRYLMVPVDEVSPGYSPRWKFKETGRGPIADSIDFLDPNILIPPFTYTYDVDIEILSNLDDLTLSTICQVNRYATDLCQDESLWRSRTKKNYPKYLPYKENNQRWQDYYKNLKFIVESSGLMYPQRALDRGQIKLLESRINIIGKVEANHSAEKGYIDFLNWMEAHGLEYPDQRGADLAAENGHLNILEWMESRNLPYPSQLGANSAAKNGHVDVLTWIKDREPIVPTQDGANLAAYGGHIVVLEWMEQHGLPHPDITGANLAARGGHVNVLEWIENRGLPYPDQTGANYAALNGHINVLEWMESRYLAYPNQNGIALARRNGHMEVIDWMNQRLSSARQY